jgi:hypothetical protein
MLKRLLMLSTRACHRGANTFVARYQVIFESGNMFVLHTVPCLRAMVGNSAASVLQSVNIESH